MRVPHHRWNDPVRTPYHHHHRYLLEQDLVIPPCTYIILLLLQPKCTKHTHTHTQIRTTQGWLIVEWEWTYSSKSASRGERSGSYEKVFQLSLRLASKYRSGSDSCLGRDAMFRWWSKASFHTCQRHVDGFFVSETYGTITLGLYGRTEECGTSTMECFVFISNQDQD